MKEPRNPWDVGFELMPTGIEIYRYGHDVEVTGSGPDKIVRFLKPQPTAAGAGAGMAWIAKAQRDRYKGQFPLDFDITSAYLALLNPEISTRGIEQIYTRLQLGWDMWNDENDRGRWSG